jgi:rhodanese-related sulfurtransferase
METQTLAKQICPTTTQEWVKNGALLVDVREKEEIKQLAYDVPEIINIPLSEFENHYTEIPKDKEVVMVCRGGGRSLKAANFLIDNGYDPEKVVNMQHGIIRWVQKGFPTKGDTSSVETKSESSSCCGTTSSGRSDSSATTTAPATKKQKITILDPALCCSTGVCGPDVDDALVQTAANVKWLKSLGYEVNRHNLSNDATAFKNYPKAVEKLQKEGADSLPYILIDGELVMTGKYPGKSEWVNWLNEGPEEISKTSKATSEELNEEKVQTLVALGAAIATSSEISLEYYTERAKAQNISVKNIAMAMNTGNQIKDAASQKIVEKANQLLNELQPAQSSSCCGGSGNGSSCC